MEPVQPCAVGREMKPGERALVRVGFIGHHVFHVEAGGAGRFFPSLKWKKRSSGFRTTVTAERVFRISWMFPCSATEGDSRNEIDADAKRQGSSRNR